MVTYGYHPKRFPDDRHDGLASPKRKKRDHDRANSSSRARGRRPELRGPRGDLAHPLAPGERGGRRGARAGDLQALGLQ